MEFFYIAIFMLIWASGSIFVKSGLAYVSPLDFLVLRSFIATIFLFVIWLAVRLVKTRKEKFLPKIHWKILPFVAGTGLLLQVMYQASFFYALQSHLSPGLLMIVLGAQPILTALIMADNLSKLNWLGLYCGLFGLCMIVFQSVFITPLNFLGIIFGLSALVAITIGTIGQKKFCSHIDFITNLLLQYLISSIVFLLIDRFHVFHEISFNREFIFVLLWMALVVSVAATCLYYYLVNSKQLTNVTTIFYGVPAVTVILDYIIYGQLISTVTLLGFFFTSLGLYFTLKFKNVVTQHAVPKPQH